MTFDRPLIPAFAPPRRILMGPGPSDVPERVLAAMARPTIGHLDPAFQVMMEELKQLLRYAFQTENQLTFPVTGAQSDAVALAAIARWHGALTLMDCVTSQGESPVLIDA